MWGETRYRFSMTGDSIRPAVFPEGVSVAAGLSSPEPKEAPMQAAIDNRTTATAEPDKRDRKRKSTFMRCLRSGADRSASGGGNPRSRYCRTGSAFDSDRQARRSRLK